MITIYIYFFVKNIRLKPEGNLYADHRRNTSEKSQFSKDALLNQRDRKRLVCQKGGFGLCLSQENREQKRSFPCRLFREIHRFESGHQSIASIVRSTISISSIGFSNNTSF